MTQLPKIEIYADDYALYLEAEFSGAGLPTITIPRPYIEALRAYFASEASND